MVFNKQAESFGNLSELAFLYLEWHDLTSLPNSFSQLTNLYNLTINNKNIKYNGIIRSCN